jgi:hypothetical protein
LQPYDQKRPNTTQYWSFSANYCVRIERLDRIVRLMRSCYGSPGERFALSWWPVVTDAPPSPATNASATLRGGREWACPGA